jgi:hypothetical protein
LEEDQVFGRKVSAVVSAARQLTTRPWNEAKKALLLAFELLDKGESGIVFDGGRYVVKCYPLEDEGYTNFVKTCIRAHQHFSDREWFSHLPKMFMYEEHDNFAVVVMEKLIRYTFIKRISSALLQWLLLSISPLFMGLCMNVGEGCIIMVSDRNSTLIRPNSINTTELMKPLMN